MAKANPKSTTKKPDFRVFTVTRTNPEAKAFWTAIGAAWGYTNKDDAQCYTVKLQALPVNGEIVLLPNTDDAGA